MEKRWLSPRECSLYLGLHEKTIYSLCGRGALPTARIGGSLRIDRKRLDELLEAKSTLHPDEAGALMERLK